MSREDLRADQRETPAPASTSGDTLTVPGNHDYWRGVGTWGVGMTLVSPSVPESHFWPLPWLYRIEDPADPSLEVHVVGLDSLAGLRHLSLRQIVARGAVSRQQLDQAAELFERERTDAAARSVNQRGVAVLRVVAMHHPPADLANQQQLVSWLAAHKVAVLLTGHRHDAPPPRLIQGTQTHELRCGTTFQCGTPTRLPSRIQNHFLLHSVKRGEGVARWRVRSYFFNSFDWQPGGDRTLNLATLAP